ncbi:MAG: DedA family protein [Simkaniaceae bacterium]|nr:DedA family protein [Simkaniaceae bacterium]
MIIDLILPHLAYAPLIAFCLILLAGMNLPISTDVILVTSAFIAGSIAPHLTLSLYLAIVLGSYFSAWISYWFGRKIGTYMLQFFFFKKMFPEARLKKIEAFYKKKGLLALLVGRFIPFGTRNCIFMSAGLSKANFTQFALRDAIACPLWATTVFFFFHSLGSNYQLLIHYLKTFNIIVFATFAIIAIFTIWIRKRRRSNQNNPKAE